MCRSEHQSEDREFQHGSTWLRRSLVWFKVFFRKHIKQNVRPSPQACGRLERRNRREWQGVCNGLRKRQMVSFCVLFFYGFNTFLINSTKHCTRNDLDFCFTYIYIYIYIYMFGHVLQGCVFVIFLPSHYECNGLEKKTQTTITKHIQQ